MLNRLASFYLFNATPVALKRFSRSSATKALPVIMSRAIDEELLQLAYIRR